MDDDVGPREAGENYAPESIRSCVYWFVKMLVVGLHAGLAAQLGQNVLTVLRPIQVQVMGKEISTQRATNE